MSLQVDYAPRRVSVEVPGSGSRVHRVSGVAAGATFHVARCDGTHADAAADADGLLQFEAPVGSGCTTVATAA